MSRSNKFRAWLKGKHNNGGIDFGDEGFMDFDPVIKNGCYCDVEGEWDIQGIYNSVPIMQYVGVKDKNSKEIYEGDIVRFMFLKNKVERKTGVVVFDTGELCYFIKTNSEWGYNHNLAWCDVEVIGNIHENPELLGVDNDKQGS